MKISLYGHFGSLNTGNESTLLAIVSHLRDVSSDCELRCICSNPKAVIERYGIAAVPITTRVVRIWNPHASLPRRLVMAPVRAGDELRQYVRAFRTLKGTDMLVIPGTGLLTDAYGLSAWGPYNLLKWSLLAKLRRGKVLFVSVGAGPIDGMLGRFLVKSSLALADYRSYRDDSSMHYLQELGFDVNADRVYPDLAFSLPEALISPSETGNGRRPIVGLGLMEYAPRYSAVDASDYTAYFEALVTLVRWLLARGYDIRLLLGDQDTHVIDEFKSLLREQMGSYDEQRVIDEPIGSVQEVISQLAAADLVVATRFHNVLLALLLGKPVIAISIQHKSASLMEEMGLSEYCHDIHQMDTDRLIEQFESLERNKSEIKRVIKRQSDEFRTSLGEQYDLLFKDLVKDC